MGTQYSRWIDKGHINFGHYLKGLIIYIGEPTLYVWIYKCVLEEVMQKWDESTRPEWIGCMAWDWELAN